MTPEQVGQSYAALRQRRDTGQLPDAEFRALVGQLVTTGADGSAWQLDADSGQWVAARPLQPVPLPTGPATNKAAPRKPWWSILLMMVAPGQILAQGLGKLSWPFALSVSGAAFALFFFQTGLDRTRGKGDWSLALALGVKGLVFGTIGIAAIGLVAWVLSQLIGGRQSPDWMVRAIALSYGSALVYSGVGLVFNLALGWNTSVSFGITGVLWALGPMMAVFKDVSGGRTYGSILMSTICGSLVLVAWGALATGK
jgi:hypothetical protein